MTNPEIDIPAVRLALARQLARIHYVYRPRATSSRTRAWEEERKYGLMQGARYCAADVCDVLHDQGMA